MMKTIISILFCFFAFCAVAAPGDELVITGRIVNMREGPSMDFPVLLKLAKGKKLVEIQRQDGWVQVQTGRDDIQSGWVYSSLIAMEAVDDSSVISELIGMESIDDSSPISEPISIEIIDESSVMSDNKIKVKSAFDLFKLAFAEFNKKMERTKGFISFTNAEFLGHGNIQVAATDLWIKLPMSDRENDLTDIFEIWGAAVGDGRSITVFIVNENGDRLMSMLR